MIVTVTSTGATLAEPDDLRRFHVEAPTEMSDEAIDLALSESAAGRLESARQAAINVAWIRASAADVTEDWEARFSGMLDFAATKGWMTADGDAVNGHLVRTGSE